MSTHLEHKSAALASIGSTIITCSDTRTPETDISGQLIRKLLEERGHRVIEYQVVKDEPYQIQLRVALDPINPAVQAVIVNGGTGIARRDSTFEAASAHFSISAVDFFATSAGMNGRTVGLPVHAVVCTQMGQWLETPSRLIFALAKVSLISLAVLNPPLSFCSMKFEGCAPAAPDFFA